MLSNEGMPSRLGIPFHEELSAHIAIAGSTHGSQQGVEGMCRTRGQGKHQPMVFRVCSHADQGVGGERILVRISLLDCEVPSPLADLPCITVLASRPEEGRLGQRAHETKCRRVDMLKAGL